MLSKETLKANRHTEPMFDAQRYTRQLEEGLDQAYQQHFEGDGENCATYDSELYLTHA